MYQQTLQLVQHPGGWGAGTHTLLPYALTVERYSVRFYFKYAMLHVMRAQSRKKEEENVLFGRYEKCVEGLFCQCLSFFVTVCHFLLAMQSKY